ncbi:MAG: hypothetical protein U0446_06850 [Dehalococcoidia bacterium]
MRWWIARRTHDAAQPEEADATDLLLSAYLDDDLAPRNATPSNVG